MLSTSSNSPATTDDATRSNNGSSISAACFLRLTPGLRLNEWIDGGEHDGATIFLHACKLGLEGFVSKRKDLPYRSGRSVHWLKMKNPACEAVRREAEEDWGK